MKDTALPITCIRAFLLQETVLRLQNCSLDLDVETKQGILWDSAVNLVNSGHSIQSSRIILVQVQGITKFLYKIEWSEQHPSDSRYRPLYLEKEFNEYECQIEKHKAKRCWFKSKNRTDDGTKVLVDSK